MIERFDLPLIAAGGRVPAPVAEYVRRADELQEDLARSRRTGWLPAFVSSDAALVYLGLRALLQVGLVDDRFLEWGSGLGTATGLAAMLGYEAYGVEIESVLVDASREFLESEGLEAEIVQGSFLPDGYIVPAEFLDPSVQTLLPGAAAYDELEFDPDDFGVIFSFPWPSQVEIHYDVFDHYAAPGAVLMTYQGTEELVLHRKLS